MPFDSFFFRKRGNKLFEFFVNLSPGMYVREQIIIYTDKMRVFNEIPITFQFEPQKFWYKFWWGNLTIEQFPKILNSFQKFKCLSLYEATAKNDRNFWIP